MKKIKRQCAYCGGVRYYAPGTPRPQDYCKCKYRFMRMGANGFETETTTGRLVSKMREEIMKHLEYMDPNENVVFKFSVTKLDDTKIAKADAKRKAGKVADKLLGKGRK